MIKLKLWYKRIMIEAYSQNIVKFTKRKLQLIDDVKQLEEKINTIRK